MKSTKIIPGIPKDKRKYSVTVDGHIIDQKDITHHHELVGGELRDALTVILPQKTVASANENEEQTTSPIFTSPAGLRYRRQLYGNLPIGTKYRTIPNTLEVIKGERTGLWDTPHAKQKVCVEITESEK